MSFIENAKKRYSVRNFQSVKVEEEKLIRILEAARIAPTGANTQAFKLIVACREEGLEKVKKAANIYGAPLAIVVCGDHEKTWKRPFDGKNLVDIDTSIVTDHMMLQATELGLGSVWICYFKPNVIKAEFNLPDNLEPVSILAVGYANGEPASPDRHDKARRPLDELVCYE
ncbi:MAG TPA: nitroreductase family protein [Ruminiclostridium sp.]|nr:nitroreductase family protein [Ruminiclostridium sp.]